MPTDHLLVEELLLGISFMPFPESYALTLHSDVCQVSPGGFICVVGRLCGGRFKLALPSDRLEHNLPGAFVLF